ncbi:jg16544 [Pararge aegeria aegeria]|uniref:Jg16544 protein n=1 Tax=Pararge aegeria aegeria TaxID=348720 RepID=A0A8S4SR93_9NEOP|nr:jg16544 [Pararge aegeria aegeria]
MGHLFPDRIARVSRPIKCADMRIASLDNSVSKEDVVGAVAKTPNEVDRRHQACFRARTELLDLYCTKPWNLEKTYGAAVDIDDDDVDDLAFRYDVAKNRLEVGDPYTKLRLK